VVGAVHEEPATGFTDKDYSNYTPEETARKEEQPSTDEVGVDEDKLYKE